MEIRPNRFLDGFEVLFILPIAFQVALRGGVQDPRLKLKPSLGHVVISPKNPFQQVGNPRVVRYARIRQISVQIEDGEIIVPVRKILSGSSVQEKGYVEPQSHSVLEGQGPAHGILKHLIAHPAHEFNRNHSNFGKRPSSWPLHWMSPGIFNNKASNVCFRTCVFPIRRRR